MSFYHEMVDRATVRKVVHYILNGDEIIADSRNYETRLDNAYRTFYKKAVEYDHNETPDLLDDANEYVSETNDVYLELGFQAGILLILDLLKNLDQIKNKEQTGQS